METLVETIYFSVLDVPQVRVRKPTWLRQPSAMFMFGVVLVSYFLVTGGIIYDVIVEPPSVGQATDERGNARPVAFMAGRVNGQYIMEGLAASFMFSLGGIGVIILDQSDRPIMPRLNRIMLSGVGCFCVFLSFVCTRMFMRMKLPGYMN